MSSSLIHSWPAFMYLVIFNNCFFYSLDFPGGSDGEESTCQCKKPRVWSLSQEGPLKKEMATHCRILTWRIPWTEEPDRLQSMESQRVRHDWATNALNRDWAISRFLLLCLTWPVIFTPRAELPAPDGREQWIAQLDWRPQHSVVLSLSIVSQLWIQRFCLSSEILLCAPWTQKLSFGRTDLNLTCGRGEAWT